MSARFARLIVAAAVLAVTGLPATAGGAPAAGCGTILQSAYPVGFTSCPGVRPGAGYLREDGDECSMSFIFLGSDKRYYAGSAGHCIWASNNVDSPNGREQQWGPGQGMVVTDVDGTPIGRFAYGAWTDSRDFSLIRLDPGVRPEAALCYFGGPTSMYTAHSSGVTFVKQYGQGIVFGSVVPARSGFATDTTDPYYVETYGLSSPGDSGSGVMTDGGQALGTLIGLSYFGQTVLTRLDTSVAEAEKFMGITLTLQTAPLEPDAVPY
jgi:hypothetical protein